MAVKNDLPPILTMRDRLEENYTEQTKHWKDVYNVVLAVGELFSNITTDDPEEKDSLKLPYPQDSQETCDHIKRSIDIGAFPEHMLGKCLWGATYSAILFSFLKNLPWSECGNTEYTTYLELMLSFQLYTGVHIPTQLKGEKHKVYQSHSLDARVSRHPSINTSL